MINDIKDLAETLRMTPVPAILIIAGIMFLLLSIVSSIGGRLRVPKQRQPISAFLGVVLLICGIGLNFIPASEAKPDQAVADQTPVITNVVVHALEQTAAGARIIRQDIHFKDPDGDAYAAHYDVVSSTATGVEVRDGEFQIAPATQKAGAVTNGTWTCGSDARYRITFAVQIRDRAGHSSNPYEYALECP